MEDKTLGFIDFFSKVPDHRIERRKLHRVEKILLLSFCALVAGRDGWDDIELFGETKLDFLRRYLPYKEGVLRNAPRNVAIIKKTVLNLLQIAKKDMKRISLKRMRKLAGWSDDFLNTVLAAHF